ncbi:hypothetical protein CLAFUW7_07111 [Fulvia fulva]|nr:hypothetical protein CLAFUW7_07111 [Fulvia fulva]
MFWSKNAALRKALISISTFAWNSYIVQDMWSRILEDKSFLEHSLAENQRHLAKHYQIITDFLKQHDIPYYRGGNAAMFVWVDLRDWLLPESDRGNHKALLSSSPDAGQYRAKIDKLGKVWIKKGVTITNGVNYCTEELGWQGFIDGSQEWKKFEEQ